MLRPLLNITNWDARPKGANYFEREWLKEVDKIPYGAACCRAYDMAATERSQVNKSPDATVSIKMYRDQNGYFYLAGEYHDQFIDKDINIKGRVCKRVGDRDNVIKLQAAYDGTECIIVSPIDPGAAGKQVYTEFAKKMSSVDIGGERYSFRVKKDPVPNNKSKLTRFLPFADAAENGLIYIVKSTFDSATYNFIMKEMEAFNGERSTSERKDDFPDAVATAYNFMCQKRIRPKYTGALTTNATTILGKSRNR